MSEDAQREIARIQATGAWVADGRVMGLLGVSRAFGDPEFKSGLDTLLADGVRLGYWGKDRAARVRLLSPPVVAVPDVAELPLGAEHEFLLMASDGLWDVCSSAQAVGLVRAELRRGASEQEAVDALLAYAVSKRRTQDNCAVVLVNTQQPQQPQP